MSEEVNQYYGIGNHQGPATQNDLPTKKVDENENRVKQVDLHSQQANNHPSNERVSEELQQDERSDPEVSRHEAHARQSTYIGETAQNEPEGSSTYRTPIENVPDLIKDTRVVVNVLMGREAQNEDYVTNECATSSDTPENDQASENDYQGAETIVKQVADVDLDGCGDDQFRERTPNVALPEENPDRDPDRRRSEGGPNDGAEEEEEKVEEVGAAVPDEAQPMPNPEAEPHADDAKLDLQDAFQNVIGIFMNITEFKKFCRASYGLGINEADISHIQDDGKPCEDQMIDMLDLWKQNNQAEATPEILQEIVANYFAHGQKPRKKATEEAHAAPQKANPEPEKLRFEDVIQNQIIPAFANITQFKKFARASRGLRLDGSDVNKICTNWRRDCHQQKIEMLKLWKMKTKDATPEMIIQIKDRYLGFPR